STSFHVLEFTVNILFLTVAVFRDTYKHTGSLLAKNVLWVHFLYARPCFFFTRRRVAAMAEHGQEKRKERKKRL
ncbi:hypothetical protein, partial [Ulvibacterium marinum]|uniref:hypothetical protein n=1 Tax=Ulvibacterium marinum TaxID=2419782 RepID=UPI0024943048